MLPYMTAILLKKIEKHSDPTLVGNLSKSSRIPTRSHQDLEAPFHNMITSRSNSSPGILFSTFPGEMRMLPTDTIFSDTPAINDGSTMAQFFVGRDTLVCDAYGIKSQKQFISSLYDNIRFRGSMTTLITDFGRYEISKKVADLLRILFIKQHESEPYHQHQNKAEQRYGVVKRYINTLINLTGAPAHCWLLCMLYVCHLLNATKSPALGGLTPLQIIDWTSP